MADTADKEFADWRFHEFTKKYWNYHVIQTDLVGFFLYEAPERMGEFNKWLKNPETKKLLSMGSFDITSNLLAVIEKLEK